MTLPTLVSVDKCRYLGQPVSVKLVFYPLKYSSLVWWNNFSYTEVLNVNAIAVSKSKAGIVVPIGDTEALTKSLLHLLHNKQVLYDISVNGKRFAQNYCWDIIGKMYYNLYLGLI